MSLQRRVLPGCQHPPPPPLTRRGQQHRILKALLLATNLQCVAPDGAAPCLRAAVLVTLQRPFSNQT
jgi:hypothetical protein